jgi:plastocyanin
MIPILKIMKRKHLIIRLSLVGALNAWMGVPAFGATNIVTIGSFFFSPASTTVNVGDTVTWSNAVFTAHDSTRSGLWASGQLNQGQRFSFVFTNAGSYPYFCAIHIVSHPEQAGTVSVVAAPNNPPTVLITNPPNGTVFAAPANVTVQASASDDVSVTNVQFLIGSIVLGNDTTSPYSAVTNGLPAGAYTLSAVASDNVGAKATNSISITVNPNQPPSVSITNPANNAVFTAPANVTIQASASDDVSVTNVQFLVGSVVVGNDTGSPYSAVTNGLPAGVYTLSAVASDNLGAKATNSISITVTSSAPSAVTLLNPTFGGGTFSFSFVTQTGYTYNAQFTPSLSPISWFTFTNVIGNGSIVQVTDSSLTNSQRYYRVGAQ